MTHFNTKYLVQNRPMENDFLWAQTAQMIYEDDFHWTDTKEKDQVWWSAILT